MQILKRVINAACSFLNLLKDPDLRSYYLEEERKSQPRIIFENLIWLLRYREINYFYFQYGFDRKEGVEQRDYFPLRQLSRIRRKTNSQKYIGDLKTNYICLLQDKFLFGKYLESLNFPTPVLKGICDSRTIRWLNDGSSSLIEDIMSHNGLDVYLKDLWGECAVGVYHLCVRENHLFIDGQETTIEAFKKLLKRRYVLQARIVQHEGMKRLYPHSINTVRLVTALTDHEPVLLAAAVRLGANGNTKDNWSAGGISVGVEPEQGTLKKEGFYRLKSNGRVQAHPDTNIAFEGYKLPFYDDAVQVAKRLHRFFYGLHSIGWDIAITGSGPTFIEANENWGLPIVQTHDHRFKEKYLNALRQAGLKY